MTTLAPAAPAPQHSDTPGAPAPGAPVRRVPWGALGLAPFGLYLALFLAVPTVLAVGSGFVDGDGRFTLDNVAALGDPVVLLALWNSCWVSLLTAVVGAPVGSAVCWALLGIREGGPVRALVDAAAGVLAQFGGVMLAFAWIATIGVQGVLTQLLAGAGVDLYADGVWLYDVPGLLLPYLFFQIPLMVITFMPALAALKPAWYEANLSLGGTRGGFWWHIGFPVLAPAFLGGVLLLFANAFSSYATAAALASQGSQILPLQIRTALTSETVLGRENLAGALALAMIVVVAVVMLGYAALQRRVARWRA